jgi:hypothetical protein
MKLTTKFLAIIGMILASTPSCKLTRTNQELHSPFGWGNSSQNTITKSISDRVVEKPTIEIQNSIKTETPSNIVKVPSQLISAKNNKSEFKIQSGIKSIKKDQVQGLPKYKRDKKNKRFIKKINTAKQTYSKLNSSEGNELSVMALIGFICGILGLLLMIITGWPFLLGTIGTIFSGIGLSQTSNNKKSGRGFAVAGLITSILAIILFWGYVALIGFLFL